MPAPRPARTSSNGHATVELTRKVDEAERQRIADCLLLAAAHLAQSANALRALAETFSPTPDF